MFPDAPDKQEVIWSDGPTGEFKNRFTVRILERLSKQHGNQFSWKFSATGHGKGVVDGVGGSVKAAVRTRTLVKNPLFRASVNNAESFANVAKKYCEATTIILSAEKDVSDYRKLVQEFEKTKAVPKISTIHVMVCDGNKTRCWRNAKFSEDSPADITIESHEEITSEATQTANKKAIDSRNVNKIGTGRVVQTTNDGDLERLEDQSEQASEESRKILQNTWDSLNPPNNEEDLVGKWYGVAFKTKRCHMLFIGKILKRFLKDEEGPVETLEIRCLKNKIGSGTILEDTPAHCPDISLFGLENVIYGPLDVIPVRGNKFNVPDYPLVLKHFDSVKNIDRSIMLNN